MIFIQEISFVFISILLNDLNILVHLILFLPILVRQEMFIAPSKDLTHSAFSLPWASINADFINSAPVLMMIMLMIRMIWRHKTMNGRYMGISYGGLQKVTKVRLN